MSREDMAGSKFDFAFGIDHVTGPFCQIWLHPAGAYDGALVVVDNTGVHHRTEDGTPHPELPADTVSKLEEIRQRMASYPGHHIGEAEVIAIGSTLEVYDNLNEVVYRIFD